MNKVWGFFSNFSGQIGKTWSELTLAKRIVLASGIVLIGFIFAALVLSAKKGNGTYLYQNLSSEDTQAIVEQLKKLGNTDYIVDKRGIMMSEEQIMPMRLKLAQEGLPAHGQIGWEKFDNQDFTRTEFEQGVQKLRAIQGELARTIIGLEGIVTARVHIVAPKQSMFVEDNKDPTAAVYVKTQRGVELGARQLKGIIHLVASSVEGLKPENIAVIDAEGKLLTKVESSDPTAKLTQEMLTFQRSIEKEFEQRIKVIVGRVVGPDRVEAKVDVEVDFTREEQTISDIDPDKVVAVASNTTSQNMDGNGLNPTGIPGSKSNVPGEQEDLVVQSSRAKSSRNSERTNFEISRKQSHRFLPVGTIRRISSAVLVDGRQPYPIDGSQPVFQPRTEEEMNKIAELTRSAIGYDEKRGDQIKVHNMLFQLDPYQVQAIKEKKKENRDYIATLVVSGIIAMALVFFFAFIVRPYFRWLSYDPERKKSEAIVEEFKPDLEMGNIQNVQVKEDVPFDKLSPQEQILYLAKHEPQRTTEAIRILLNPHGAA